MFSILYDCFIDIYERTPGLPEIEECIEHLPESITSLAGQYGWNDTEVRDKIYIWLAERKINAS